MKLEYILFDLDGTIIDPTYSITESIIYALEKFGISVNNREELYCFIGPPLTDSFSSVYGFSKDDAALAVKYYREHFVKTGIYLNKLYEGMAELLKKLLDEGKKLILATSKPEEYADLILKDLGVRQYFTFVCGNTLQDLRHKKEDVMSYILEKYPEISYENSVMVGDRVFDIKGAEAFSLRSIGVLYGFGDEAELCGADYLAKDVKALEKTFGDLDK